MPWARTDPMSERLKFIRHLSGVRGLLLGPPQHLPQPEYPARWETRLVYPNGVFSFFSMTQWYTSICLAGERIGLEPCDDGRWRVHYGFVPIGTLDLKGAMERRDRRFGRLILIVDQSHRRPRPPYGRQEVSPMCPVYSVDHVPGCTFRAPEAPPPHTLTPP